MCVATGRVPVVDDSDTTAQRDFDVVMPHQQGVNEPHTRLTSLEPTAGRHTHSLWVGATNGTPAYCSSSLHLFT